MRRNSDFDYIKLHFQELYAEAERYRLIKNSKQSQPANTTRWYSRLWEHLTAWLTRLGCLFQNRIPQNMFPGVNRLVLDSGPCACAPEPCKE
jgi:hypothetical protein